MGFLDALKGVAGEAAGAEAHQVLGGLLENSSVGGVSGLLGQLQQGGLGDVVSQLQNGQGGGVTADLIRGALSDEHLQSIASALGVSPDEAAQHLADHLPAMAQAAASGDDSQ